jgi:PAS domain S-box-containing protein
MTTTKQRLAAIVESSTDAIIGMSPDSTITSWNHGAEVLFGYTAGDAVGSRVADLLVPQSLQQEEDNILTQIALGQHVRNFDTRRLHKDGQLIDVSVTVSPIRDVSGRVVGASKTVRDISAQKAEEMRMRDLNARQEQQIELRTSELKEVNRLLGSVLHAASEVSIIATDCDGIIRTFNRGAEKMLGYTADEMVGKQSPAVIHVAEEVQARAEELTIELGTSIDGFRVFVCKAEINGAEIREWTYIRKDGSRFPVELAVTSMRDADGSISGYLGVAIDLTRRKMAEQALASSLELMRAIFDTAVQPIVTADSRGIVRSINNAGLQHFGYTQEEIVGNNVKMLMPEPFRSSHDDYIARYLREGTPHIIGQGREVVAKRKDGSLFQIQLSVGSVFVSGERVFVALMIDISALHRQRDELVMMRDQLALASEVAEIGIWTWTPDDGRLQWNDRMFALYDWPLTLREHGVTYNHWRMRVHPDDVEETEAKLSGAVQGCDVYDPVFRIVHRNGDVIYVQAAAQIERDAGGKAIRVTGINRNVTAQRELETSLRRAKIQAEAASEAKSNFLANMSHEIRTPMNAVLGMLQLLQRTELNGHQRDHVVKAMAAARSLLELLNDILDYSKIEAGKLELDTHPFDLAALMRELSIVLEGNLGNKTVDVQIRLDPDIPAVLIGDSLRLRQVLVNLSGNALKFTPEGYVRITTTLQRRQDDRIFLRFAVQDTGIGISPEQQQRIFEGFTQAEASISRRFGGTGLGLVICTRLVDLMGGKLQLNSALEVGSNFWFDIPLDIAADQHAMPIAGQGGADASTSERACSPRPDSIAPAQHEQRLNGLRILVVEDNEVNRNVAESLLLDEGAIVTLATGGLQGVRQAALSCDSLDIILMDLQMPDIDGLEATRRIRANPALNPIPIVAMTANVAPSDRAACVAAGMNGHIGKPIYVDDLVDTILEVTSKRITIGAPAVISDTGGLNGSNGSIIESIDSIKRRFPRKLGKLAGMLPEFEANSSSVLDTLQEQLIQQDLDGAIRSMHTLKGTAGSFGAQKLSALAADYERRWQIPAPESLSKNQCDAILSELRELLTASCELLRALLQPLAETNPQPSPPAEIPHFRESLCNVLTLLEASDLRAIDEIKKLNVNSGPGQQMRLSAIVADIEALEFDSACLKLRRYLENVL